jgi:HTH-type transcriptional regulator, competence development regulator
MTIGARIRRLREQKGWNQSELATRADIKQSILSRIEGGSRPNPTTDIVRSLARALGCTADYLIGMYEEDESERMPAA